MATRWSQVVHVLFEGCRFTAPMQSYGPGQPVIGRGVIWLQVVGGLLCMIVCRLSANTSISKDFKTKLPFDLSGQPLIDRPDFDSLMKSGQFGRLNSRRERRGLLASDQ